MIDWEKIVREHSPLVWKTAYRLLGNHADSLDCLQDTFLAAVEFSRRKTVRDWPALLQHLATARAIDCLRKRLRETSRRAPEVDWPQVPALTPGPADEAESAELVDRLRHALIELPQNEARVYVLRSVNGLSYRRIAEQLETTSNRVAVLLHRARNRLRHLLVPSMNASLKEPHDD